MDKFHSILTYINDRKHALLNVAFEGMIPRQGKTSIRNVKERYTTYQMGIKVHPIPNLRRLGTDYGGYSIPTQIVGKDSICYCIGAGEDISFECELAEEYSCHVYICDPTPRAIKHFESLVLCVKSGVPMPINNSNEFFYRISKENINRIRFIPYGICSENVERNFYAPRNPRHVSHSLVNLQKTNSSFRAKCLTIKSIMEKENHDHIDLLKLNIEGAEYEVVNSLIRDKIKPRVLCINFDEIHSPLDKNANGRIRSCLQSLTHYGFVPVIKEAAQIGFIRK